MYPNISFEQLGEITRPKAVDCLRGNVAAIPCIRCCGSPIMAVPSFGSRRPHGENPLRKTKLENVVSNGGTRRFRFRDGQVVTTNNEFIVSWIAHAPAQLQGSVIDYWIQKEKQSAPPLLLKTNGCTRDCPIMLSSLQDHRYLAWKLKLSSTFNP